MTGLLRHARTFVTDAHGRPPPTRPTAAATDLAEYLVDRRHAVPRRPRRRRRARARSRSTAARPLADLVAAHPDLGPDAVALLEPARRCAGAPRRAAPGPAPVAAQLERFRAPAGRPTALAS